MIEKLTKLFQKSVPDNLDDFFGCDMVPSPYTMNELSTAQVNRAESMIARTATVGPFTTNARAPIRDS